jgi:thioredoxin 1
MKKVIFSLAAISLLLISCSMGSASSLDSGSDKDPATVMTTGESSVSGEQTEGSGKPVYLTKKDFLEKVMNYEEHQTEWVYEGDKPALIDFYADWCGPCRMAAPVLEELAKEYEGRIHIYKVDTQKERELAAVFGIQTLPSFLFVPTEGRPSMSNGVAQTPEATKEMFRQMINEILLGEKPKEKS